MNDSTFNPAPAAAGTARGLPKAAPVGLQDLTALENLPAGIGPGEAALAEVDDLVERIRQRRQGVFVSDSADDLAAIREGDR